MSILSGASSGGWFEKAQRFGKSFMLPIAVLPAAGLLLGIGGALSNPNTVKAYPFLDVGWLQGEDKTHWLYVPLVGVPWFLLYYFTFRVVITRFDFKTPGREDVSAESPLIASGERPLQVIEALGGKANIAELDCCATRLRITLHDSAKLNEAALKATGARAVIQRGKGVQVIYGPHVTIIKNEVEELLAL